MTKRQSPVAYSNFRDPVGVALRMLRKATRESVWPLAQAAATVVAKPFDSLAARWERLTTDGASDRPQILIVGSPRSGSTLLSQVLARSLQVSYFPNISALFPSAPIWISRKWLRDFDFAPQALSSFYGNTVGFRGINDGFHVWNRWLGHNRYRVDHQPSAAEESDLKAFFATWAATFSKPLLNKNNRNVDALELLARLLPNSYFVIVQRDPVMIVQSLLQARRFIQGSENEGWGLFADDARHDDALESTCRQVACIHHRIQEQCANILPSRRLCLPYEQFCKAPSAAIDQVAAMVPQLAMRTNAGSTLGSLRSRQSSSLNDSEVKRIEAVLARHGFDRWEPATEPSFPIEEVQERSIQARSGSQ